MNKTQRDYTNAGLLWVDLEMTGLDPTKDRILEVAVILTRLDLVKIDTFESGIKQNEAELRALVSANPFALSRPKETEELLQISLAGKAETEVEKEILSLISTHFTDVDVYVAGNSVHADMGFIKQWWPNLHKRLDYRILDVTSWKIMFEGRFGANFEKAETHRALTDIEESIAELKFYLDARR